MPPCRSVFRCLLPLLFALGLSGTILADSGAEAGECPADQESVKMLNRAERLGVVGELIRAERCEADAEPADGNRTGTDLNPEALLWLDELLLVELPIEELDFSEAGERDELASRRMQRAVLGSKNVRLWERDEAAGADLFAEVQAAVQFAESDTIGLLVSPQMQAANFSTILASSDFTGWLSRVAPLPVSQIVLTRDFAHAPPRSGDSSTRHLVLGDNLAALARDPPHNARVSQLMGVGFIGGGAGSPHFAASSERADAPLPIDQVKFETVHQDCWGPTKNVLAKGNHILKANRSLAALKLDGVGDSWDKEGYDLGGIMNLDSYTLTLTGAGLLSVGEKRNKIWNGTLATTRDNFEIHVTGGGIDSKGRSYGGLEIAAVMVNGANGTTGLIKTGDGELILSNQTKNTFLGEVRVERGTLTLRSKDGAIAAKTIFVGDGSGPAILNLKGGRDHINPEATVVLRGGENGESAVLRFEKTHPNKGVVQSLDKLVIEGSGVIEFIDPFITDGKGTSPNKNALYIDELDLRGDLTIRGWDQYDTQIFIKRSAQTDAELLSKIHVEGHDNLQIKQGPDGFWSLEAAPIPEPATCAVIVVSGAVVTFATRRKRPRLRTLRSVWRKLLSRFG